MSHHTYKIGDVCTLTKGEYATLKTEPGKYPLVVTASFRRTANTYQMEGPAVCVPLISSTGHGHAALHRVHYEEGKFALANLLVALRPKDPAKCYAKYLYYFLTAKKDELFVPLMQGTANVSLKDTDVAGVRVTLPPVDEQRHIVARIEELSAKIEEAHKLRTLAARAAEILLAKLMTDAFRPYRDLLVPIGSVFKVTTGGTPSRNNPSYWGGTIRWVSSGEVAFCRIQDTAEKITELGQANSNAKLYPPGTVLIAMIGQGKTRGQCAILDCHAGTNQNVAGIHVYETPHCPEYVYWWLYSRYQESRSTETGTAQPALSGERVKAMPIPLPSLDEQLAVAHRLEALSLQFGELQRKQLESATELNALTPSILSKVFSGEI